MAEWVTLAELKNDNSLDGQTLSRDDEALQRVLDAAMTFVEVHRPDLEYLGPHTVPKHIRLGTLRLAASWSVRSSVDLGELGSRRAPRLEPEVYTMLGIEP